MAQDLTRNAANPKKVKIAERIATRREARFNDALRASLQHPEVRYVMGELFDRWNLRGLSFDHSGSVMYWREGQRKAAVDLFVWCEGVDEKMVELLERERRALRRADEREADAAHTPAAGSEGADDGS